MIKALKMIARIMITDPSDGGLCDWSADSTIVTADSTIATADGSC